MADGDDREIGHAGERAVHSGLVLQVERARRLVEDGELRLVDEQPREGEALQVRARG
mgnify:CR=1 FL=1